MRGMTLEQHLTWLGGVATRKTLVHLTSRREVEQALASGRIVRYGHGRYGLPFVGEAIQAANALSGVASHRSAAGHWGWAMKTPPGMPSVTVPRKRRVDQRRRVGVDVTWADLGPDDVEGPATSMRRTLSDCLRTLPFDEALCIADSALQMGSITKPELVQLAAGIRGRGAVQARRVAGAADGGAANPFESVLRAIALDVPGLAVVPQHPVTVGDQVLHPDLADARARVIVEAESFQWHGDRRALRRDCRRYNAFTIAGWVVIRFSWEDVMLDPVYVRNTLAALLRKPTGTSRRHAA
jgi:very-short-patch-repair endonuclease